MAIKRTTDFIKFTVTPKEKAEFQVLADRLGMKLAVFARYATAKERDRILKEQAA